MDKMKTLIEILSIITIFMCGTQKVPQVLRIIKTESSEGISKLSLFLELFSYSAMESYCSLNDYNLLSYCENHLLIFQQLILINLVLYFSPQTSMFAQCTSFIIVGMIRLLPASVLTLFVLLATPVSLFSKAIQLKYILVTRNVESISVYTWMMSSFTNATRIITTLCHSADSLLLSNYILSTLLSSSITLCCVLFKQKTKAE